MIVRYHVQRNRDTTGALHAAQERPQQLPYEEDVAGLPVALAVGEVDEAMVVRVDGPAVGAADALGRARGSRAVE